MRILRLTFLLAVIAISSMSQLKAETGAIRMLYYGRPLSQPMHHYGIGEQWTWLPGCIAGTWYRHSPPREITRTLYDGRYSCWGEGLNEIPALTHIDLDQLARDNHWPTIRQNLQNALNQVRESQTVNRRAYLRLRAHCDGVGLLP